MEVKAYSPKLRMLYRKNIRSMLTWYEEVAPDYGVTPDELFEEITDFAMLSVRVNVNGKSGLDFEPIRKGDDDETIKNKSLAFLETDTFNEWSTIEKAVREFDSPSEEATAPQAEGLDPNLEGGGESGSKK